MAKKKTDNKGKKGSSSKKPTKQNKGNKGKKDSTFVKVTKPEKVIKQPTRKTPSHIDLSKESKDFKHVIRISGRDVPGYMSIGDGVCFIYGVGNRLSKIIEKKFIEKTEKKTNKAGYLTDEDVEIIEKMILELDKEVPVWLLNRAKTMDGNKKHLIMADLRLENRKDLQNLGKTKSYRGLRLQWGLTVRGQKTKSSFRKSGAVGVSKKK